MIICQFENGKRTSMRHVVVHAIVEQDGRILLGKRSEDILEGGKWGLPGGFLDRDETLEEGVLRELYEETGWKGEVISLFRINSNPDRPGEDRQNVGFDFLIRPLRKTGEGDSESTKVEWIAIEDLLPFDRFAFDHGQGIRLYLEYRTKKRPLPILT